MAHRPDRDPPVLLPPGELAGQHRTGPTGPPPPWGARWPAPHRTHRSSSPLGSSLASTAQDPPVLLPPGELAGQHRTGPTGPPPPWGARWPAPHRTHRSSSPLGSSLASTAQDPPVLLPPGELAGQHRTGPTGPPPPWGARWPAPHRTHRSSSPLGSSLASTAQDPPVLLPPGELAGQHRTGPTGPPPPWGARWPAPHRTHRSSSPLGSSLASTAQDPPVLLPPGELAGQHRTGPTGPPPPWGARWPAPHRTHRSSSPLGSSLASTAQDPPVLLPPGELAGQHRTGATGPPPPWGARWPAPHRTHRSSSPLGSSLASTGPTGPPPPWGARWPAPHRTHRSSSPLGSSLASTAQDPPVLLPPGELAGQHRTGPTGPPPPWGARWPAPHRTHRSSSPLGSSLASTAQDPPVLLPPGELAGQHRTGPTGPPPPWGARWPAPHRTHRSSSPLGSSLASTAQDPPVLLPPGELAGQHHTGAHGVVPNVCRSLSSPRFFTATQSYGSCLAPI
ncbi:unnamed protein product [Closterium sp. Yama58-4]|nr:unnamed protein product [Closterium sp. Yama58-4]